MKKNDLTTAEEMGYFEEGKTEPVQKEPLSSVLIERVSNGYIVYENEHRYNNSPTIGERKVFENQESLFEFLTHNI